MSPTYEARGSVRGGCGHRHRTLSSALRCAQKDQSACHSLNPSGSLTRSYSDRDVVRTDGEPLTASELRDLEGLGGES